MTRTWQQIADDFAAALRPVMPEGRIETSEEVGLINQLARLAHKREPQDSGLKPTRKALETIKRFEGCRLQAYPDPGTGGDPWTIGWGATGPGIRKGVVWTQEQADQRLQEDVGRFAEGVAALIGEAPTTQDQFDALVSFAYNVGLGALEKSTLLKKHRAGDFEGAANEFRKWVNAGGRPLEGLKKRRAAETALYRGVA